MTSFAGYFGGEYRQDILSSMLQALPFFSGSRPLDYHQGGVFCVASDSSSFYKDEGSGIVVLSSGIFEPAKILNLYKQHGFSCVKLMAGAFAFCIHDPDKNLVFIARDRAGIASLFYAYTPPGEMVVASELKSLLKHDLLQAVFDETCLDLYLSCGFEDVFLKGVHAFPAGHSGIWNPGLRVMIEPYDMFEDYASEAKKNSSQTSVTIFEKAVMDDLSNKSGDVAIFLKGDVASTAMAMALAKTGRQVFSFSIKSQEETVSVKLAKRLGFKHQEIVVVPAEMQALMEMTWSADMPISSIETAFDVLMIRALSPGLNLVSPLGLAELCGGDQNIKNVYRAQKVPKSFFGMLKPVFSLFYPLATSDNFCKAMRGRDLSAQYKSLADIFSKAEKQDLLKNDVLHVLKSDIDNPKKPWPGIVSALTASLQFRTRIFEKAVLEKRVSAYQSCGYSCPGLSQEMMAMLISLPDEMKISPTSDMVFFRRYIMDQWPALKNLSSTISYSAKDFVNARPMKEIIDVYLSDESLK